MFLELKPRYLLLVTKNYRGGLQKSLLRGWKLSVLLIVWLKWLTRMLYSASHPRVELTAIDLIGFTQTGRLITTRAVSRSPGFTFHLNLFSCDNETLLWLTSEEDSLITNFWFGGGRDKLLPIASSGLRKVMPNYLWLSFSGFIVRTPKKHWRGCSLSRSVTT